VPHLRPGLTFQEVKVRRDPACPVCANLQRVVVR